MKMKGLDHLGNKPGKRTDRQVDALEKDRTNSGNRCSFGINTVMAPNWIQWDSASKPTHRFSVQNFYDAD